jgi:hypothetical protein
MRKTSYDSMICEKFSGLHVAGKCRMATHNCEGHDESPEGSHGVSFESFNNRHVVLHILGFNGPRLVRRGGSLLRKCSIFDFGEGSLLLGRVGVGFHFGIHADRVSRRMGEVKYGSKGRMKKTGTNRYGESGEKKLGEEW